MKFPRSSNGLYNISSVPSINSEQYSIVINDFYIIAIPKNNAAKKHFGKWSKECSKVKDNSQLPHLIANLEELITDKSKFILIDNQEQAYREYMKISWDNHLTASKLAPIFDNETGEKIPLLSVPEIPVNSFELFKIWFNTGLERLKAKSIYDNSIELLNTLEVRFINYSIARMKHFYADETTNDIPLADFSVNDITAGVAQASIKWLEEQLAGITTGEKAIPNINKKPILKPETFDELFYDKDFVEPCINVLRNIDLALIDKNCNYIGKSKGAFYVWMDEMRIQGIIKHYSDRKIYPTLLCKKIKRFSIDESMFGKHHKRAEENYRQDFKTLLSKIKLSQDSQKGKLGK